MRASLVGGTALALVALCAVPRDAGAQPTRSAVACRGQRISRVNVVTGAARVQRDSLDWWDVPEERLRRTRRT
ncbi:MAG TPA: hypothetical protein VFX50_17880, partial [Gemmatimonadales bacterium]|nr:hypothetical protein [Gemmatimonadales bacterium]